jgi:UDP-glucose 4-epimerase
MVIPRFVQQALRGEAITVYGNGTQSRCFCDVQDVVRAISSLAEYPHSPCTVYNIGSTEEISINSLAERIKTITCSTSPIIRIPYDQAYAPGFEDMMRRIPDTSRIEAMIGWKPTSSLDAILLSVIEYEKKAL